MSGLNTPLPFDLSSHYVYVDASHQWLLQDLRVGVKDQGPSRRYDIRPRSIPRHSDTPTAVPVQISAAGSSLSSTAKQLHFIAAVSPQHDALDDSTRAGHFEPLTTDGDSSDEEEDTQVQQPHAAFAFAGPSDPTRLLLNVSSTSEPLELRFNLEHRAACQKALLSNPSASGTSSQRPSLTPLTLSPRLQGGSPLASPRGPRPPSSHTRGWSFSAGDRRSSSGEPNESPSVVVQSPSVDAIPSIPIRPESGNGEVELLFTTCAQASHLGDFVRDITIEAQQQKQQHQNHVAESGQEEASRLQAAKSVIEKHAARLTCKAVELQSSDSKHVSFATLVKPRSSTLRDSAGQPLLCAFVELQHADKSAKVVLAWQFWMSAGQQNTSATVPEATQSFTTQVSEPTPPIGFPLSSDEAPLQGQLETSPSVVFSAPLLASLDRTEVSLEEMESDSPVVRAAFANLDRRTAALKKACKAILKCSTDVKANMAALQASESGLDDCFTALASALTPNGYEEVAKRTIAEERTRSARMRDEQLRCLNEFVDIPIKALLELCRRAHEAHAAFETESKSYYAATQKWLSKSGAAQDSAGAGGSQQSNHEKQRHRELRFLLTRLELFDAFTCLHGGQAELDLAASALASYSRLNQVAVNLWTTEHDNVRNVGLAISEAFVPPFDAERQRVSSTRFACAQRIAVVQSHLAASEAALAKTKSSDEGALSREHLPLSASPQKENDFARAGRTERLNELASSPSIDPKLFPELPSVSPQGKKQRFRNILGSIGGTAAMDPITSPSVHSTASRNGVDSPLIEDAAFSPTESPQRQRNFRQLRQQMTDRIQNSQVTAAAVKAKNKWRSGSTVPWASSQGSPEVESGPPMLMADADASFEMLDTTVPSSAHPRKSSERAPRPSFGDRQRQPLRSMSGKRVPSNGSATKESSNLPSVRFSSGSSVDTAHGASPHRSTSLSGANSSAGAGLGLVNRMRSDLSAIRTRNRVTSLGTNHDNAKRANGYNNHAGQRAAMDLPPGPPQLASLSASPPFHYSPVLATAEISPLTQVNAQSKAQGDRALMPPPSAAALAATNGLRPPNSPPGRKKEGILWVMSKAISGPAGVDAPRGVNRSYHWREAWVVLSGSGHLSEYSEWKDGNKILSPSSPMIDLRFATVREARGVDRRFAFEVVTRDHRRFFQAPSDEGMQEWMRAISKAIESLINGTSSVRQVDKVASRSQKQVSPLIHGDVFEGPRAEGTLNEADEWSGDEDRRPKDVFAELSGGGNSGNATGDTQGLGLHRPWSQSLTDLGGLTSGISGMSPARLFQRSSGNESSATDHSGRVGSPLLNPKRRSGSKAVSQGQGQDNGRTARHSGASSESHQRDSHVTMYTALSEASSSSHAAGNRGSNVSTTGSKAPSTATATATTTTPTPSASSGISNRTPVSGYIGLDTIEGNTSSPDPRQTHLRRSVRGPKGSQILSEGGTPHSNSGWTLNGAHSEHDFELDQRIEALVNSHYGSTSDFVTFAASGGPSSPIPGGPQPTFHRHSGSMDVDVPLSGVGLSGGNGSATRPHQHQRSASTGVARPSSSSRPMTRTSTAASDKYTRAAEVVSIASKPENATCADCGEANPRWASWALNGVPSCIFICIRCSGMHRSLGVHISKVKSVDLDDWTEEQLQSARDWGNERVNKMYEGRAVDVDRPRSGNSPHKKDFWIKKYVECAWKTDGGGDSDANGSNKDGISSSAHPTTSNIPA